MTTSDTRRLDDEPTAPSTADDATTTRPVGRTYASRSLTGAEAPTAAPTTTRLDVEDGLVPDVTADLELAVELADEIALTLRLHSTLAADADTADAETVDAGSDGNDAAPAVQLWVDAGEVLARFGVDGWAEYSRLDEQIRELHETFGPQHPLTRSAMADRDAVDALSQRDEAAYQEALVAAVEQVALERGIEVEVLPLRMAQNLSAGPERAESQAASLRAAAERRAVLPQLGRAPGDLTSGEVVAAVRAAGRTYLERIGTGERPEPVAGHDQLEEQLETELEADELLPDVPGPVVAELIPGLLTDPRLVDDPPAADDDASSR
ncbi:hypothetical protein ACIGB8_16185 [Promicromonospora sukumoe]|uniref:hypothetical protein n=1 Tax=Promicromonospora sukumoe TaxID=88382 RepID=UPI0037C9B911